MITVLFRLLVTYLLAGVIAPTAYACSCITGRALQTQLSNASYVFIARVISTHEIKSRSDIPQWGGVSANFTLVKEIKGKSKSLGVVETGYGDGDCGVPLSVGRTYIFFAGPKGEIDICSGTQGYISGYEPHENSLLKIMSLTNHAAKP